MKLQRRTRQGLVFQVSTRERRLLLDTLRLYPLVPVAHHRISRSAATSRTAEDQRLLEDSLNEQRRANRRQLESLLREPQRFRPIQGGFLLTLNPGEMEWLLQVLNDVRVGSWLALGEPDEDHLPQVAPENLRYVLALEVCGIFQSVLLAALDGKASPEGQTPS